MKADWIYRDNIYGVAGPLEFLGTYTPRGTTVAAGPTVAAGKILYDSKDYITTAMSPGVGLIAAVSPASRSQGSKAKILRVQGVINYVPSTWALGSQMLIGFRFGIFEQNPSSGNILLPPAYSLWQENVDIMDNPAVYADAPFSHERRAFTRFSDNAPAWQARFNFPVNRTLMSDQCFAVYIEVADASGGLQAGVTTIIQPWLRTLVVDEG